MKYTQLIEEGFCVFESVLTAGILTDLRRITDQVHDLIDAPHSKELAQGTNLAAVEFTNRPDEIDVPIRAGDLLLGDARLLHATHANETDERRTLLTLWYQPDLISLPERMRAQMAAKTQQIPESWPQQARALVEPLLAHYEGIAEPYGRSLYRPRGQKSLLR